MGLPEGLVVFVKASCPTCQAVVPALTRLMAGQWKKGAIPQKWDGKAAQRIVEHLERLLVHA